MSRFIDPKATMRFVIGPCECPGKPHDEDWVDVRAQLSGVEQQLINAAGPADRLLMLLTGWNLLESTGETAPLDAAHVSLVYGDWFDRFQEWLNANIKLTPLPNASAVPSPDSSRGNGSHTPTPKTGATSTTSSLPPAAGVTTTSGSPPPIS